MPKGWFNSFQRSKLQTNERINAPETTLKVVRQ
jgi:hypothetical protein